MKKSFWVLSLACLVGGIWAADKTSREKEIPEMEFRGRVICLLEAMTEKYQVRIPARHDHLYGFRTTNGQFYTLIRNHSSEALFTDPEVQARELIIKGRLFPQSQLLEVTLFKSVKNGVIHELYYYCEICEIRSVSPEICLCCQGPTRLVETAEKAVAER